MNNYWEPNDPSPTQPKRDYTWLYWVAGFIAIALIAGCMGYEDESDEISKRQFVVRSGFYDYQQFVEREENGK